MNIYAFLAFPSYTKEYLGKMNSLGNFQVIQSQKLSSVEIIRRYPDIEILLAAPSGIEGVDRQLLDGLKNLKFISTMTVGTDWIDLNYAKKKGLPISNAKGCNSQSVAEHTWGMIINLTKRISEFDRDIRNKGAYKFADYKGIEVYRKTLGIIGLGDIGTRVAYIAKGFNMQIIGMNKSGKKIAGVKLVSKSELLKRSDIIAICVPLTHDTRKLIGKSEIAKMKDGVVLVNCAREAIVDKKAVIDAIKKAKIFGYGVETEIMTPLAKDDPYLSHPRILVNVHNAFNTKETDENEDEIVYQNVKAFLAGKPINVVN